MSATSQHEYIFGRSIADWQTLLLRETTTPDRLIRRLIVSRFLRSAPKNAAPVNACVVKP
jgi:hypothetical protein